MATTSDERDSAHKWRDGECQALTGRLARGSNNNLGGSDMTATDKLVEKNCLLAELMRLAAKKR
jgi:hypothetical protein